MLINTLIILESTIFFILSAIHFYWAIGGQWGFDKALPTNEKGERMLHPTKVHSVVVGIGLLLFGLFFLLKMGMFSINMPAWIMNYGAWFIAVIFLLRAIGDFKYVGFFKKIKQTEFGLLDSKYFVPLCFMIALVAAMIGWLY